MDILGSKKFVGTAAGEGDPRSMKYTTASGSHKKASLLSIPYELRHQIFFYLLPWKENLIIDYIENPAAGSNEKFPNLCVCKRNALTGEQLEPGFSCPGCLLSFNGRQFRATQQIGPPRKFTDVFAKRSQRYPIEETYPNQIKPDVNNGQLLRICRQINEEATDILYGNNRFQIICEYGCLGSVVSFLSLMRPMTLQSMRRLGFIGLLPSLLNASDQLTKIQMLLVEYELKTTTAFFEIVESMKIVELLACFDLTHVPGSTEIYSLNPSPWLEPFLSRFKPSQTFIEDISLFPLRGKRKHSLAEGLIDQLNTTGFKASAEWYSLIRHAKCGRSKWACECHDMKRCGHCQAQRKCRCWENDDRCPCFDEILCSCQTRIFAPDLRQCVVRFEDGKMHLDDYVVEEEEEG